VSEGELELLSLPLSLVEGEEPDPPGQRVKVRSEFSLQTVVRTSSGAL
jgi:hypothetical protein